MVVIQSGGRAASIVPSSLAVSFNVASVSCSVMAVAGRNPGMTSK